MKKILCLALAMSFAFSLCTFLAPAGAAEELPAISEKAEAIYDADSGYVKAFDPGATAKDVEAVFTDTVTVTDPAGNVLAPSDPVGTDYLVKSGSASAKILVYGDTDGDANVNARDIIAIMRSLLAGGAAINTLAADLSPDGEINAKDIIALMKYLVGYDIALGVRYWGINTDKQEAEFEDATMQMSFFDSLAKNAPDSDVMSEDHSFTMRLAKNEKESCQAEIFSFEKQTDLNATLTDFVSRTGDVLESKLLFVQYIKLTDVQQGGAYTGRTVPDALPPMKQNFTINANTRQGLYIEVSSDENTKADLYRARLDITDAEGKVVKTAYVYANVWDFTLPVESHIKTAFGMSGYSIVTNAYKGDVVENSELYIQYYEYLLDNRINPWCLPFNPLDDRADEWMNDPRVNTFLIAGGYMGDNYNHMLAMDDAQMGNVIDEEALKEVGEKMKTNPEWMKKQLIYATDEPGVIWPGDNWGGRDKIGEAKAQYEAVQRVFPEARVIIPMTLDFFQDEYMAYGDKEYGDRYGYGHVDTQELCAQISNVLCPCIDIFTTPDINIPDVNNRYTEEHERVYGPFVDRIKKWSDEGKEIWWYTANAPRPPMCNISQRSSGLQNRMTLWQTYAYDVEGFLYWASTEWGPRKRYTIDVDAGVLVYPGIDYGVNGPVACQRAGIFRDGMEDVEYLFIAKELLGEEYVDGVVNRLVRTVNDFETDPAILLAVRDELGAAIDAAMNQK